MTTPALAQNVKGKGRHYQGRDGELVPSVTNVLSVLGKGEALTRWAAKMVAETAWNMRLSLDNMDREEAVTVLKQSPWRRSKRAADRGTDIHGWLEARLNEWELPELSDDARPFEAAADDWYLAHDIEVLHTEATLFHPLYAGTCDFIARIDGRLTIGDFKTSKAIYPETALQLAALFGCGNDKHGDPVPWRDSDGEFTEIPQLMVVRIGTDGWEEKTVAEPVENLRVFLSLLDAWRWKHGEVWE